MTRVIDKNKKTVYKLNMIDHDRYVEYVYGDQTKNRGLVDELQQQAEKQFPGRGPFQFVMPPYEVRYQKAKKESEEQYAALSDEEKAEQKRIEIGL